MRPFQYKRQISESFLLIAVIIAGCGPSSNEIDYGNNNGKVVSIFNTEIYYEEYGQGAPLILLSGGGLDRSIHDFSKCIPGLAEHFRVIVPDTPGQGRSGQPDTMTYEILVQFTSQLIDSLKLDSAYVMGWSDGGITGIQLAERRPDKIRKVIAVGANNGLRRAIPPEIPIDSVYPMKFDFFERVNKEIVDRYSNLSPKKDWKKFMNSANAMVYQKESYYADSIYSRINIPVLVVLGDRDDIIIEHGLEMYRLIKKGQLCVLPNTTHEVFLKKPALINTIAIDFLK